ncbi:conserved hypothetical protein [Ferroglobus placidus DSM 10642]|uniref:DUF2150 domain-containing protein n=1 Tax=Ferroglobus placidus (strain DSM 10642 / AEDII12DO) TaxID=589924 RepID=D3RY81_FERPA|nr:DUF2150 family protein [Ferroglobus placidus]ADC65444.1 conserved hypothetical protein [Ferroglobus placidus DSM 10642]
MYDEKWFNNWIERIKSEEIDLDNVDTLEVFDKFLEDVVVACYNLLRAVKERELKKKEAEEELKKVKEMLEREIDLGDEIKNDLFTMTKESAKLVVRAAEIALSGKVSKKSFEKLLEEALRKEKEGKIEEAFEIIAMMGAKIFRNEKLPEMEFPEESELLEYFDGLDAINTVILLSEIDAGESEEEG